MTLVGVLLAALALQAACGGETGLTGDESWGGRKAHPAVVNSVTAIKDDPYTLSLRGEWDFKALPRTNLRNHHTSLTFTGHGKTWDEPTYRGKSAPLLKLQVPGCWEAQLAKLPGYGVATGRTWYCDWDCSPKPVRGHHSGDGWYRRAVKLPEAWKGRRIWLKTGWVNSQGWFWVNGKQVAMDQNYCATRKYEVTDLVRFGEENMVVVQVCNAVPSHRGCVNYSEHWGGILRDLEFEATPETFIDDAWVRGDFDRHMAEAHVTIEGKREEVRGKRLLVTVEDETREIDLRSTPSPSTFTLEIPLRDFRPWSPEHPNLYTAKVELVSLDGAVLQTRFERFGVRKLELRGRDLFLNGKPFYLRGAGWHSIDPISGYARPDRMEWLGHARQVRAAGFNIVRTHTECKMPEFFEACDEAGLMVETELPYYGDVPSDGQRFDPLADLDMLWSNFRRYPSFAIYSFGNESGFGADLSERMYALAKARDPDRLVVGQDGALYPDSLHAPNRRGTSDFAGAPVNVIPRGSYRPELPFYFHEYINSSVKLDTRVVDGFTGVWAPPTSRAARADFLGRFGLDGTWGDRLQDGQNRMQRIYLKYGLETARLNRWACGYSYWSLQDACPPQGESVVGQALWDPFWHEKACGARTAEVVVFNSPSCVLMTDASDPQEHPEGEYKWPMFLDSTVTNLVRTSGERIRAVFHLAHFGERPMTGAKLSWRLVADGRELDGGVRDVGDQVLGGVRKLAEVEIAVPPLERAVRAKLEAEVGGVKNAWTYWLFPERKPVDGTGLVCEEKYLAALVRRYPGIRAATSGDAAALSGARAVVAELGGALEKAALAAGRRTVALANLTGEPNVTLGWWAMTEQLGAALKAHAMTSLLPHEGLFEQFLFRIGRTGLALPVEGFSGDDYVMVGEGGKGCYLYLAAKRLSNGAERRLIAGLDVLADTREGSAILDAAIEKEME